MQTEARAHLAAVDPILAEIIKQAGDRELAITSEGTHFHHLLRTIVHQQLAGAAAQTIHGRVLGIYGGRAPEPAELLATPDRELRRAGLSGQKVSYVRDLARRSASGDIPWDTLDALPDEEIVIALTRVKGIGRWSAHMFLMFRLGRPDVLPELDYGVRKGMQIAYRLRKLPTPRRMQELTAAWAPYRSVGSWYMWRVLELPSSRRPPKWKTGAKPARGAKPKSRVKGKSKQRSKPRDRRR